MYRACASLAGQISDLRIESLCLSGLGDSLLRAGSARESIPILEKAAAGHTLREDWFRAADAWTRLCESRRLTGENRLALESCQQAIELARRSNDDLALGRAWSAAGSAASRAGNYRVAIPYILSALEIAEKLKSLTGQAAVLNNLAIAYHEEGDYETASSYLQRSIDIKLKLGPDTSMATAWSNLGNNLTEAGRFPEAEERLLLALEDARAHGDRRTEMMALDNLSELAGRQNKPVDQLNWARRALEVAEKIDSPRLLCEALLYVAKARIDGGGAKDAGPELDRAEQLAPGINPHLEIRALRTRAAWHLALGHTEESRQGLREAVRHIEEYRHSIVGDERSLDAFQNFERSIYDELIDLEARTGSPAEAFRYSELSRSRVLLDALTSGHSRFRAALTPAEAERSARLESDVASLSLRLTAMDTASPPARGLRTQVDAARKEYAAFRATVFAAHPELALRRADPEPLSIDEAAALVPDDRSAWLSWSVGPARSWLFILTRRAGKPVYQVRQIDVGEKQLVAQAADLRRQIAGRTLGFTALSNKLYAELLQPVTADLAGKTRLVIFPDGPLWQIPFEVLQPAGGRFLVQDREVFYAPSATVLRKMQSTAHGTGDDSILAFADSSGDLPEARGEANAIAKIYGPAHSKVLTGAAARESDLIAQAGNYSLLHLAVHGTWDDANPLYSWLQFNAGQGSDGALEAYEIMDLDLKARLVVLSGCETARNAGRGGGIAGMAWAFFIAGVPATVASLWKVDSASTTALMTNFYSHLSRGQSAAWALRAAKLHVMTDPRFRHPFYWAGFIGIGAGN